MPELKTLQQRDLQYYAAKAGHTDVSYTAYTPATLNDIADEDGSKVETAIAIYYYHSDHLGSNTFITDISGKPYQLFLNLPFGESMAEQHSTGYFQSPYKFNGKELDKETGLYYYGARYYDPRTSVWLSVDPLAEKYPGLSPYAYTYNNPIIYIDPNGLEGWPVTRGWNRSDINGYSQYATSKIQDFKKNKIKDDCANFALRLIVGYASKNGLPLSLKNNAGKTFNSGDDEYNSPIEYLNEVRSGIQAIDLTSNTYGVPQSDTHAGDMEIIQYILHEGLPAGWQHVVIFENIDPSNVNQSDLVWGNEPADKSELKGSNKNWPRFSSYYPEQEQWSIMSGNMNSRWDVLNPANMQTRGAMQKMQSKTNGQIPLSSPILESQRAYDE